MRVHTCQDFYCLLISPIRAVAKQCGYVLTIEGTVDCSINMGAIPWTTKHSSLEELFKAIANVCKRAIDLGWTDLITSTNDLKTWKIYLTESIFIALSLSELVKELA